MKYLFILFKGSLVLYNEGCYVSEYRFSHHQNITPQLNLSRVLMKKGTQDNVLYFHYHVPLSIFFLALRYNSSRHYKFFEIYAAIIMGQFI